MNIEVRSLRLEFIFAQLPPPAQYNLLLRRSPAASRGLDKPGVPHTMTQQTEQRGTFSCQVSVNGFLHINRIPEKEITISFQADVGANLEITKVQVAARQEFARLPKNRQQRGVTAWGTE